MTRPRLLDLYSGAGGAGMGYHRAGFDVVGVDHKPMPRYPFEFHQGDALEFLAAHGHEFACIHASPPCQAHSAMKTMPDAREHPDLIPETRNLLIRSGRPFVIENVVGAPLINPTMLCGTMFGLGVDDAELRRHRLFETNFLVLAQRCAHGGHIRNRKRTIGVYGEGVRDSVRKRDCGRPDFGKDVGCRAMGINWMTLTELCQAIPPAYTEYIGRQLIAAIANTEMAVTR